MKISVVIAAKNEEENIAACIESASFADEIILIDDESADQTAAIAKAHGATVLTRRMDGFASQKNYGIAKAQNDWIFILDADERVSPLLRRELEGREPRAGVVGYSMPFRNFVGRRWLRYGGLYPDRHIRLFNRRSARYGRREIHETLDIGKGAVEELSGHILHYTYKNFGEYLEKVRRYAALEASWSTERPSWRDIFETFKEKFVQLKGYKDGAAGLVSALLLAYYQVIKRRIKSP